MVQRLVGDDGIVGAVGVPVIEICLNEGQVLVKLSNLGCAVAARQHVGVEVKTFNGKIPVA